MTTIEDSKKKRRSFTLKDVQMRAESLGGKCLAQKYANSTYRMLFECKEGHRWRASALDLFGKKSTEGKWCPKCSS